MKVLKNQSMKRILFILLLLPSIWACRAMINEVKKVNVVRDIARDLCECKFVSVDKGRDRGNSVMTITLTESKSTDHLATAESIYRVVQDSFPKICGFGRVTFVFEHPEFDEHIIYWNCKMQPDQDTIFPPEEVPEDEWDVYMEDTVSK